MTGSSEVNVSVVADLARDEELARAEIAILAAILVITISGNSAVMFALYALKYCVGHKKLSRMYYFILHLCVADLLTGLLNVFPQLCWKITYRFRGGPVLCKAVKYGQTLGPYLSSYILVATAVDRYKAVCDPLTYFAWSSRRSGLTVIAAWALTLLFCTPQVLIFSYQEIAPGVFDCWATFPGAWGERLYVTWYSVSVFLVPLCVLIYTYFFICWSLWRYAGLPESSSHHLLISRAKINTVKQTVVVIVIYVACSSPFVCAQLWAVWVPQPPHFFDGVAFTILTLLSSLNSCVNPWIYLTFNRELVRSLCTWSPRRRGYRGSTSSAGRRITATEVTNTTDSQTTRRCDTVDMDDHHGGKITSLKMVRPVNVNELQDLTSSRRHKPTKEVRVGPMM